MKVAVVGNCQSRPVARFIAALCPDILVLPEIVTQLQTPDHLDTNYEILREADVIFAQFVTDNYQAGHLATSVLKREFGKCVFSWPNVFFTGQSPEVASMAITNSAKIIGPLDTYHLLPIYAAWKQSMTACECVEYLLNDSKIASGAVDCSHVSMSELIHREKLLDVTISDYIDSKWRCQNLFHVFNHPTNQLLLELTKRLLKCAGITVVRDVLPYFWPELLNRVIVPTLPNTKSALRLKYPTTTASKGFSLAIDSNSKLSLGSVEILSLPQLVESFYIAYDKQLRRDERVMFTPVYLDVRQVA